MSAVQALDVLADEKFDFSARVDALRGHPNDVLRTKLNDARLEQERWWLEELAITRVLDEREALDPVPDPKQSARSNKMNKSVARELEALPEIAAAAHTGNISRDQLAPIVELATPETDREWSRRGAHMSPGDLDRLARRTQKITAADAAARHQAREVRSWRDLERGMAGGRWWLPDVDGVLVDKVLEHMAERMRPPKGEKWDSLAHRKADALVELVRNYAEIEPTGKFRIEIVNIVRSDVDPGATIEGIPLADETIAALLPNAKVRECRLDENGVARTVRPPRVPLPRDIERHVRRRDESCRNPGCENARRLQIHHMEPVSVFGESWDVHKLAAVCPSCHQLLEPHGPYRLVGDAEEPDGLRLRSRDGPDP